MSVDISERVREINAILSFLRVLRTDQESPADESGFLFAFLLWWLLAIKSNWELHMHRDLELTAALLNGISNLEFNAQISLSEIMQGLESDNFNPQGGRGVVLEHISRLVSAGFVEGRVTNDGYLLKDAVVWRLTWEGQDLLDSLTK
ncbi:DUF2513 domain-containing protein [Pseudomonas hunanensis]|uniref:DUF2513 domain-containing protein n=1 Tax=Pseudomonas hunanensis TaxID=1247546 RepID=UPI0015BA7A10|nr:DUF2513 domain-containing protein [Pseudomonas hunanensis]NWL07832.1 hypothetical protein [Pseudomonas hunanensis]